MIGETGKTNPILAELDCDDSCAASGGQQEEVASDRRNRENEPNLAELDCDDCPVLSRDQQRK